MFCQITQNLLKKLNVFMQVTIMFYEHAIDDVTRVFGGASEQGNIEIVFFKTGLTGSTGLIHRKGPEEHKAQMHKSLNSQEIIRTGTRITRIGRIYTDPCVSASTVAPVDVAQPSRQLTPYTRMPAHGHTWTRPQGAQPLTYGSCHTWRSVFYRTPPLIDDDKKPQMNADKRRFVAINNELIRTETNSGNAKVIFQTVLIGCVLSFNPVIKQGVAQWT
jgi:hypothetical protein